MNVYLVEDCKNSPGKLYAIFADIDDATSFADSLEVVEKIHTVIVERTLHYGQPDVLGLNK